MGTLFCIPPARFYLTHTHTHTLTHTLSLPLSHQHTHSLFLALALSLALSLSLFFCVRVCAWISPAFSLSPFLSRARARPCSLVPCSLSRARAFSHTPTLLSSLSFSRAHFLSRVLYLSRSLPLSFSLSHTHAYFPSPSHTPLLQTHTRAPARAPCHKICNTHITPHITVHI